MVKQAIQIIGTIGIPFTIIKRTKQGTNLKTKVCKLSGKYQYLESSHSSPHPLLIYDHLHCSSKFTTVQCSVLCPYYVMKGPVSYIRIISKRFLCIHLLFTKNIHTFIIEELFVCCAGSMGLVVFSHRVHPAYYPHPHHLAHHGVPLPGPEYSDCHC